MFAVDIDASGYFNTLVDMVTQVLDGNLDSNQYEDNLREMYGIHAYVAFTLDKVVQNIVRQVSDYWCEKAYNLTIFSPSFNTSSAMKLVSNA